MTLLGEDKKIHRNNSLMPEETITETPIEVPTDKASKKKRPEKTEDVSDIEIARKMIKIYQSAVDRKLDFDLSFATVKKLLMYKTCFYTNREFVEDAGHLHARSFDRVDSSKGYVEGNVVACTIEINQKKSNLTNDEIELLYNKLILKK